LKNTLTILLFIVTCLSHLDIVECYNYYGHTQKGDFSRLTKGGPQEDDSFQKEIKEKAEDQYCSRNSFLNHSLFMLLNNKKFIITNTELNIHSFTDDILQPPELVG
jgi:hypothetical protein